MSKAVETEMLDEARMCFFTGGDASGGTGLQVFNEPSLCGRPPQKVRSRLLSVTARGQVNVEYKPIV